MKYEVKDNRLICFNGEQTIWIEPWGENSLRVRVTREANMDVNDWALAEPINPLKADIKLIRLM